jgi:DNA-binding NtrC family response regulator
VPSVLAVFGPKRGVRLEIGGPLLVGRSPGADLQLVDAKVSREHCRFTAASGVVRLEDLGSQNGTYVNGARLEAPRPLAPGDEIAVGDSLLVFDAAVEVAAARFGEATVVVGPGDPAPATPPALATTPAPRALERGRALALALARSRSTVEATDILLGAMLEALAPERAFVVLGGIAGKPLKPLAAHAAGPPAEPDGGAVVAVSRTVLDLAAAGRRAVVLDDAVAERALKEARSVLRHGLRSVVVAPLLVDGRAAGFLHVDRTGPGLYAPEDAALLDLFAAAASLHGLGGALPTQGSRAPASAAAAGVVGTSAAMRKVLRLAGAAAPVASTVLITGESGVGKEEIARLIHASGARAARPFVAVNCGAIPEALAESELFGHQKGAFTGASSTRTGRIEEADGGTLFLDEIGDLPPSIQVKLLRVLQERVFFRVGSGAPRPVDVRIIAATHRDLEADVKGGRFREDLFFRLDVVRIHIPPLRERPEDIAPLAAALLERVAARLGRPNPGLGAAAAATLGRGRWPGNARELGNVLERALVLRPPGERQPLEEDEIAAALGGFDVPARPEGKGDGAVTPLSAKVAALERAEIVDALRRCRGIKARAAAQLGISRPTLDKKMADLEIDLWGDNA